MKSSLFSIYDLRALAVVQVKLELEMKMKTLQHPVPNNFCVYIVLFSFCQVYFMCPYNPSLHSYKWPCVFGAP